MLSVNLFIIAIDKPRFGTEICYRLIVRYNKLGGRMNKPRVLFNEDNFNSDSIADGRIVKNFLKKLTSEVYSISYKYYSAYQDMAIGGFEYPLLHKERNLYSIYATAINKLSAVHLSEWGFNKNENEDLNKNRRVDFFTKYRRGITGKPTNFFIELKCGWYCLNRSASGNIQKRVQSKLSSLVSQLRTLRATNQKWDNHHDVNIGLMQIHGYYTKGKESFTCLDLASCIHDICDKRTVKNYLVSTVRFPDKMEFQWDKNRCRFISIFSTVV